MVEQLELISESLYTVVLVPCGYEHRGDLGGGLWPPIHALSFRSTHLRGCGPTRRRARA